MIRPPALHRVTITSLTKFLPIVLLIGSPFLAVSISAAFTECEYYQHACPASPTTYPYDNGNLIVIEGRVAPASTQPNDAFVYTRGSSEPGRPRPRRNTGRGRQEQASFRGDSSTRLADDDCIPSCIQRECVLAQVFRSGPASRPAFFATARNLSYTRCIQEDLRHGRHCPRTREHELRGQSSR